MFNIIEKDITNFSTIKTRAYAKYFCIINNLDDLIQAINFSKEKQINYKMLGKGSNILFSKEHYDNLLFLKLGKAFNFFNVEKKYVHIGASHSFIQAGRKLLSLGYEDFMFFNLIPANIGGAVRQNAGVGNGQEIRDLLFSCTLYDVKDNKVIELKNNNLEFSYRNSIIKKNPNRYLILSSKFILDNRTDNISELLINMKNRVKEKIDREPNGYCFGSTFMNNEKNAWQYIDSIYGDLKFSNHFYFSKKHKNWIINIKGSGKEIESLIKNVQMIIKDKFNVNLKIEVDII